MNSSYIWMEGLLCIINELKVFFDPQTGKFHLEIYSFRAVMKRLFT